MLVTFYMALVVFGIGLVYKVSTWFRFSLDPETRKVSAAKRLGAAASGILLTLFSRKILTLLRVFAVDVLLQVRTFKEDRLRWLMHILIYWGFTLLLLFHALDDVVTANLISDYSATLNPPLFLRDLFGFAVIVGVAIAFYRRMFMRLPRLQTSVMDKYAIGIVALIIISGFLLGGLKITSYTRYQEMVEDYAALEDEEELEALETVWVKDYGLISPQVTAPFDDELYEMGSELNEESCVSCHSRPQTAVFSYLTSRILKPVAHGLDSAGFTTLLWHIHFLACFVGLAYLPFSKMFHLFTGPLSLLSNAVMNRETSDPLNIATRQMMELDACTHCGSCTLRCSMGVVYEEIPNINILPSEKLGVLKTLAAGKTIDKKQLKELKEGLMLCTNCLKCTGVCPVNINLQELWLSARETVLADNLPEWLLLSPLSLYRGLMRDGIDPARYPAPAEATRQALAETFKSVDGQNETFKPDRLTGELKEKLGLSLQGSTFPYCFTCKTCTSACPVVHNYEQPFDRLDLAPHQIIHSVALGLGDLIFNSRMLWACLGCYQCQQQCPQGVKVTDILYELKNIAYEKNRETVSAS